jgi:hypothetical protein
MLATIGLSVQPKGLLKLFAARDGPSCISGVMEFAAGQGLIEPVAGKRFGHDLDVLDELIVDQHKGAARWLAASVLKLLGPMLPPLVGLRRMPMGHRHLKAAAMAVAVQGATIDAGNGPSVT